MSGAESIERETKGKHRRKKVHPPPLCHACQACHNHTKECTVDSQYPWTGSHDPSQIQDKLLGLTGDGNTPADKTIIVTSENDIIITDNEIKGQKQRRKEDSTTQMNSMCSI